MASRRWGVYFLAAVFSVSLNFQLRWPERFGFYSDDYVHLVGRLRFPPPSQGLGALLRRDVLTDEPLFNLYHTVRYRVLGADPARHHLWLGIIVAANAMLAFALVMRLSADALFSFVFLLLFLTYPNRGSAYYWAAAIYAPLLLCLLASMHLWLSWLAGARRWTWAMAWLLSTAATFTHEAAFGFLAIFAGLWYWKRRPLSNWRECRRDLLPFVLANLAYLVVRQTRWFGFGEGGLAPDRPLSWPAVLPNIVESIRQTLGENFLVALHHQMREGAVTEKMAISLAAVLAAVLAAAALAGNSLRDFRHRIEGVALVASALVAGVLYTAQAPFPGVVPVVESLLRVTVLLPLATLVAARMQWISLDPRLAGLAAFAALWFLAAYAPTYSLHVAERHSYIPSFGLCLLLSIALWLPAACARNYLRRRLLEGVALGMSVFVGHGFYMAALGEAAWWVAANRWIGRLKSQMQEAYPSLPPDSRVVVLDVPELYQTVPLLPSWGVEGALKHWYDSSEVRADKSFIPRKDDFFAPHSRSRDHYQRLLLLRYKNEVLGRIDYLRFQDGARVRVGTAVAGSPPDPEAVLDVREGQLVR